MTARARRRRRRRRNEAIMRVGDRGKSIFLQYFCLPLLRSRYGVLEECKLNFLLINLAVMTRHVGIDVRCRSACEG